ncbi:hypothetical protein [Liquorilactobacillus mali]|uniref:Uncharacterized protein n=1 Tax=Liquorilactobacillus mali KCTC 3596 = DSM 20444 TaxID=1046596 RepID=A0A0R2E2S8_9LACO|nr:hypothetical protein [Liquorilactobacillus mali]KRN09371.1 hypothetical protein FD00_GL001094 [Liquorilactobacillus mali KCTC 3596 = DSM 20444]
MKAKETVNIIAGILGLKDVSDDAKIETIKNVVGDNRVPIMTHDGYVKDIREKFPNKVWSDKDFEVTNRGIINQEKAMLGGK